VPPRDVCLFYGGLCCSWTCLFSVLSLDVSVWLQQSVMSTKVSGLQLHACASNARICSTADIAVTRGLMAYSTAACAASLLSVCKSLYISWACLFTWALVLHLVCLSTRALWCTWTCLSTRTFAVPVRVCLQELCDAPGRVCLQEYRQHWNCRCSVIKNFLVCFGLFRNRYVYFGCFDTCSKHRNKPKKLFFGFVKQTETQPKQIEFRFFSVRTENIFCLFRGHPNYN